MVGDLYQGMKRKERRYFTVIDGIVAGEGQGPFCPTSKNANTLIAGEDLLATDVVATRYMGFNPDKISYLKYFLDKEYDGVSYNAISVIENSQEQKSFFDRHTNYSDFLVVEQWNDIKFT